MQLEPHRVVPSHPPAVLEAQDLFQAQLRVQRPECRLRVLRGNPEAPVEPWQELLQHPVGFHDAVGAGQPEFSCQPVLERSRRSLHATLRLGRQGENHLNPQFLHGPAELGWHPGETGAGRVPEDPVPVGVEGDGYATTLHQALEQPEVVVGILSCSQKRATTTVPVASSTAESIAKWGPSSPSYR